MHGLAFLARHLDASTFCGDDTQYGSNISAAALESSRLPVDGFLGRSDRLTESYGISNAIGPIIATAADPMEITLLRISRHRMIRST